MADTHDAAYARLALSRQKIIAQIMPVFQKYQITFLHAVRGLSWDKECNEFTPNTAQEYEHIDACQDAFAVAIDWPCACVDFRFAQWDFELYLYKDERHQSSMENVALSFPNSLYKAATQSSDLATRWLWFFEEIGIALGNIVMMCGTGVMITAYTESEILARFEQYLARFGQVVSSVHTLLCARSLLNEQMRDRANMAGFIIAEIKDDYQLMTLLKHGSG
jgi:hypothetical protein